MSALFEEIGHEHTPLGDLSLRRRRVAAIGRDVYEVKLGDEFLMSSMFTDSETVLGTAGVAEALEGLRAIRSDRCASDADVDVIDVVVGGLGLGYTAAAVLDSPAVRSLIVVELFDAVIDWHRRGLVPIGRRVSDDPRCRLVKGDFFALSGSPDGFDPDAPARRFDAVLVDIDHSPDRLLDPANAGFYGETGLQSARAHLTDGGVLGVWSDLPPDQAFTDRLRRVFTRVTPLPVTFDNPLRGEPYTQSVYLARRDADQ